VFGLARDRLGITRMSSSLSTLPVTPLGRVRCRSGSAHRHRGRCAPETRSDVTRRRCRKCLASLCLCRCRRGGGDARALAPVAGSDPCVRHASHATAAVGMCTAIPPSPGVAPGPAIPCGKAKRRAGTGPVPSMVGDAVQPTGQPVGQRVLRRFQIVPTHHRR